MKPERFAFIALLIMMLVNAGCAGFEGRMPHFMVFSEQERTLNEAVDQLRIGKEQQARELLEKVVIGIPMAGITDEALFRLSLLSMKEDGGKGIQRAQTLLERLAGTYPESIWTRQSAPLLSHLAEFRVLRNRLRELRTQKELNLSLSHDNREMRQSLERLKQLDLELEKKIMR
jgi:hypothetical protein